MKRLYRVNYEEYLNYEEFIEASSAEEAKTLFENTIDKLEPLNGEIYTFDAESTTGEVEDDEDVEPTNAKTSNGVEHRLGEVGKKV